MKGADLIELDTFLSVVAFSGILCGRIETLPLQTLFRSMLSIGSSNLELIGVIDLKVPILLNRSKLFTLLSNFSEYFFSTLTFDANAATVGLWLPFLFGVVCLDNEICVEILFI